jgi:protoheme IX farnesyltransferase
VALLKPRVMSLSIFSAFAGLIAAPGHIHPWLGFVALFAIAIGAGACGALNMWYDADIDRLMRRTASRPVPKGTIQPDEALGFGLTLAVGSVLMLGLLVNWVAAALLAFTIFFYIAIYTIFLKRRTPQNIVIGGAAGAFPPMIGWAAVTGSVDLASIALFLIIFMWTPPHFWALALWKTVNADYSRAGVPMLPVVAGADETRRQILLYSLVLAPLALLPAGLGAASWLYAVGSAVSGLVFVWLAIVVWRCREGAAAERALRNLFKFSLLYLFAVFSLLILERLIGIVPFAPVMG